MIVNKYYVSNSIFKWIFLDNFLHELKWFQVLLTLGIIYIYISVYVSSVYIYIFSYNYSVYMYIRGAFNKFPDFFVEAFNIGNSVCYCYTSY